MKKELINKIEDFVDTHGGMLMPDVTISLGKVVSVMVDYVCSSVEVQIITNADEGGEYPDTYVGAESLPVEDLEKIYGALLSE